MEKLSLFISKYKLAYLASIFLLGVLYVRFNDIRGSFFPDSYGFIETKGQIIRSQIKDGIKPRYQLDLKYSYFVDKKKYYSERLGFGFRGSRYKEGVSHIISQYKNGDQITVYYSKRNPDFSVIDINFNSRSDLLIFFIFWSSLIALLFFVSRKNNRTGR